MPGEFQVEEAAASGAGGEGTWAGESYEKASALSPDAAFHRFAKRLRRRPEQCARSAAGQDVLWPKSKAPVPTMCAPPVPHACMASMVLRMR